MKIYNEHNHSGMTARALKNIPRDEQLTISYIDQNEPVEKRRKILTEYGFICNCAKCVAQGGFVKTV